MNKEALEQVVRVLKEVEALPARKQQFDMYSWYNVGYVEKKDTQAMLKGLLDDQPRNNLLIPHLCGSSACACGYAGLDPWFRERGFKTRASGIIEYDAHPNHTTLITIMQFFDLNDLESQYLFVPQDWDGEDDQTIESVRERVENFIRTKTIPQDWLELAECNE